MARLRRLAVLAAAIAVAAALRHRATHEGLSAEGGVLIADAPRYDRLTGWLLGSFYGGVAADVAAAARRGARVLDIGCGPGHLVERLADRGLEVTGVDLDPAMIARARRRLGDRARLLTADVANLPLPDAEFDLVVSTLSMHHWANPQAGLVEIARVLKPDGGALIFDLGGAHVPLHGHVPEPARHLEGTRLEPVDSTPWRWPGPFTLVRRVEARPRR